MDVRSANLNKYAANMAEGLSADHLGDGAPLLKAVKNVLICLLAQKVPARNHTRPTQYAPVRSRHPPVLDAHHTKTTV